MDKRNLEMIADFYEFTMSNGYFVKKINDIAYFDIFFIKVPDNGGFAIFAGNCVDRMCREWNADFYAGASGSEGWGGSRAGAGFKER